MSRIVILLAGLAVLVALAVGGSSPIVQGASVSHTLFAKDIAWHVDSNTSSTTTITMQVNDTLHLRIENQDSLMHTFTAPQFPAEPAQGGGGSTLNVTLTAGRVFFWNHTMTSSDVGNWQFFCIPHSTGNYPTRSGMTGKIVVQAAAPPPAASDSTTLIIGGVIIVVAIVAVVAAVAMRRRPKPPAQP